MPESLSPNTQAILLLTAPLSTGAEPNDLPLVTPARYRKLASLLHDADLQPSDFLEEKKGQALDVCQEVLNEVEAELLLGRGLQLSQNTRHFLDLFLLWI